MTTWMKLCRVCSSPAEYEIFAKIPNYLHGASNDFINWQKPINILLEEVTGFKVTESDGLPRKICALCISYLKHACTFREQAIKNMLSLKVIQEVMHLKQNSSEPLRQSDKDSLLISEQELEPVSDRKMDPNILLNNANGTQQFKVNKELLSATFDMPVTMPSQQYIEEQMRYINLLFDKDINTGLNYNNDLRRNNNRRRKNNANNADETFYVNQGRFDNEDYETETSSDENQNQQGKENIFSYREKNFEEDDIMQDLGNSITVNLPESCKERKCRACFRRFMFEETYKEHMEVCTEYNFLVFTEEINRLWDIRRSKAVSPHEFIRRTIFSLRKICDWLKTHCTDIMVPDLNIANGDAAANRQSDGSGEADIVSRTGNNQNKEFFLDESTILKRISSSEDDEERTLDETVIENLCIKNIAKSSTENFYTPEFSQTPEKGMSTPITIQNNILYEIERAEHQHQRDNLSGVGEATVNSSAATSLISNVQVHKPIPVHANVANILAPSLIAAHTGPTVIDVFSTPPRKAIESVQSTPSISVRKDLLPSPIMNTACNLEGMWALSAVEEQLQKQASSTTPQSPLVAPATPKGFSARCNSCSMTFETISQFEVHNAMHHNTTNEQRQLKQQQLIDTINPNDSKAEEQRRRIIAMFEDDNNM